MSNQTCYLLKRNVIVLVFLFFSTFVLKAESNTVPRDLVKIDVCNTANTPLFPLEKIYIHFDRSSYFLGDKIWFKVYLLDGATNIPSTTSKVVYVDLIDQSNQVVKTRTIHTKDGGGDGEFDLGLDMAEGLYTIRSYTNYMRNFDPSFFL